MSRSLPSTAVVSSPADRLITLPSGIPALTLGFEAALWAHRWLKQPNGPRAGQPFRFTDEQMRFLLWWYALDEEGQWLFSHGVRRLAKGSGKSPFAAVLALIEFCAPVRLDRFDDRVLLGGCRGKPMLMPLVQIAATSEAQTANTMRMVRALAPKGSAVVEEHGLDPGKTRYYKLPEGTLEVITSSPTAAEGAEPSFAVGDETEHWKPTNGGIELASTLQDNLTKSGSRLLETANAWVPGDESVAEASFDAWVAQEEGRTKGDAKILYDARVAPPGTDMADPVSLRAALEHVYRDCWWQDIRPIMNRIWKPNAKPDDSKRKYLNQPTVAEDAWTTPEAWALLTDSTRVVEPDEEIVLFFDGSKSRDATALIGCCVGDGHVFTVDVWEPDHAHNTNSTVDVIDVDRVVQLAFDTWDVVGFFGDVQEWESFVKIDWPTRFKDRLDIKSVPTGKAPESIAWDMRTHTFDFTQAVELVEAEIKDGLFSHDGDPRLARHVKNCRRRPNRYGVSIGKETKDSPKKIDAGVCMVGARMVRRLVLASPRRRKRSGRAAFL